MSVKIASLRTLVTALAILYLPGDRGELVAHEFEVQFKRPTKDEREQFNAWMAAGKRPAPVDGSRDAEKDADGKVPFLVTHLLDETVAGWGGMLDEQGQPVPYTHAERRATDQVYDGLESAMGVAWYSTFWINQREAKEKNFVTPSRTGSA